jgi:DnaK suppressor protein
VSKTPAKSSTPLKAAARKPAPKAAVKTAVKAPAKKAAHPAAKASAPRPTAKPVAKPASKPDAKPAVKAAAKPVAKPPAKPAAKQAAHHAAPAKPAASVHSSPAATVTSVEPTPMAASRFADRFAPPKPPARQLSDPSMDTLKPAVKADPKLANAWKTKSGRDLSEAELLAMPDAEYMNEKQLDFFRSRLTALKDDLLSNAGETTEHLREDTSIVPDPADRATIEEEHALELRTRDRERKLLKKISQSLARIDAGDYGFCDETGEPIGLGRLLARPTATLSLEAQQRRELKQKMFGD